MSTSKPTSLVTLLAVLSCGIPPVPAVPDPTPETPNLDASTEIDSGLGRDAGTITTVTPDAGPTPATWVQTPTGPVIGEDDGSVTSYLGIPYAEAPVGARRFRRSERHAPWSSTFDAGAFGLPCPQRADLSGDITAFSEDCLTLNVWRPTRASPKPRPAMVFIHGGAFRAGSSSKPLYDGARLALDGDVVVLSFNYRLGALGFLAHPSLAAEDDAGSSGNYGFQDQQLALQWIKDALPAFGGDPARLTVFGESAGAMSVCLHLAAPGSKNLFQRAIAQSGSCLAFDLPLSSVDGGRSAQSLGTTAATALGCTGQDVAACLRTASVDAVLDAPFPQLPQPNIDGTTLVEPPRDTYRLGRTHPVNAFIGGFNHDEATLFTRSVQVTTEAQLVQELERLVPGHGAQVAALYPRGSTETPTVRDAYQAAFTDVVFWCPTRTQLRELGARGTSTYSYRFDFVTPLQRLSGLGAMHGAELPFVFGTLDASAPAAQQRLSTRMRQQWSRFATTGVPDTAWPTHPSASFRFDTVPSTMAVPSAMRCDVLEPWL